MKIVGGQHMGLPVRYGTAAQLLIESLDAEIDQLNRVRDMLKGLIALTPEPDYATQPADRGESTQPIRRRKNDPGPAHPWRGAGQPKRKYVRKAHVQSEGTEQGKPETRAEREMKTPGEGAGPTTGQKMTPAEATRWLATAPEPFGSESIQAGTGLDGDQARNLLCRLRMKEQIERVAQNQWKRTANFVAE